MLQCNCSILGDPQTREALVIDPGDDVDQILDPSRAPPTQSSRHRQHSHPHRPRRRPRPPAPSHRRPSFDPRKRYGALPQPSRPSPVAGRSRPRAHPIESFLRDGDTLRWGHFQARVLHTPGHTPGSISLWIPDTRSLTELTPVAGAANAAGAKPRPGGRDQRAAPNRRRHIIRRKYWQDRPVGRIIPRHNQLNSREALGPAGRNPSDPRPRRIHHHRPRKRIQSLPNRPRNLGSGFLDLGREGNSECFGVRS